MSKEKFEQAIELAKLQAKISDSQTHHYSTIATLFAFIAVFLVAGITTLDLSLKNGLLFAVVSFAVILVLELVFSYRTRDGWRADFKKIYDEKRIEY